jgi:hypothetical protein
MISGPEHKNQLSQGRGNQYWRNAIWWAIQNAGGPEGFEPVRQMVKQHFPDITLRQPILGDTDNPPAILIRYQEPNSQMLDIAQSGGGLHTFLSLAQMMQQSMANVLLLDEPDSHLHASQQAIVVDLLTRVALEDNRQVILATHSPEFIIRVPRDSLRWLERGNPRAKGGLDTAELLDRLGATPDVYISMEHFPEIIVYVEGDDDKPILERLIAWCRAHTQAILPTTQVVRHKDGKFNAVALQGISRTLSELRIAARVVGVRDLDWDYKDYPSLPPSNDTDKREGSGYVLLTLPCKELENTFCNAGFLFQALSGAIPLDVLQAIIAQEAMNPKLIGDLSHHAKPQIRDRYQAKDAPHRKEENAETEFQKWEADSNLCARLISGRQLLGRIRTRLQRDHGVRFSLNIAFDRLITLPSPWDIVAAAIFPGFTPQVIQTTGEAARNEPETSGA